MAETKFAKSIRKIKQATEREHQKRKRAICIEVPPAMAKISITSVETNLPKLKIQDLITPPREDPLAILVHALVIDKDDDDGLTNLIPEILSSIQPIESGRRTRFKKACKNHAIEVHIRRSLDVWIILEGNKLIFPKPRDDRYFEPQQT